MLSDRNIEKSEFNKYILKYSDFKKKYELEKEIILKLKSYNIYINITENSIKISDVLNKIKTNIPAIIISNNVSKESKNKPLLNEDEFQIMSLDDFIINPLNHIYTPPQRLLSDKEILKVECDNILHINITDKMVKWLGGKKGDVLEIKRPSPNSLISYMHRLVVDVNKKIK